MENLASENSENLDIVTILYRALNDARLALDHIHAFSSGQIENHPSPAVVYDNRWTAKNALEDIELAHKQLAKIGFASDQVKGGYNVCGCAIHPVQKLTDKN